MSEPELKYLDVEITWCTPNPEWLAASWGVVCPCRAGISNISEHTEACRAQRPKPNPVRAHLFGWRNAREAMRYDLKPYPLHYLINGPEYRRRRRAR